MESERSGVLQHLIEGNDLSLYGLSYAVTRYAQDVESYDRFTELEGVGYKIPTMDPRYLLSTLMRREADKESKFHVRWGEQKIA